MREETHLNQSPFCEKVGGGGGSRKIKMRETQSTETRDGGRDSV